MLIYIPEKDVIHADALSLLTQNGVKTVFTLDEEAKQSEGLFIRTYISASKSYLDQFPRLKYLLKAGVGLNNVDVEECKKRNITIISAPGSNANAVAEYVIALMLTILRNIPTQVHSLEKGGWRLKDEQGEEIKDKIVGIVGCGAIGKLVAKKLASFEVNKILGYDPYLSKEVLAQLGIVKCEFNDLLKTADVITLHLPLMPETRQIINNKTLGIMKPSAYLINTSRGDIVNEENLIAALDNNKLQGAALDVFHNEPNISSSIVNHKKIVATPHIAMYTLTADREMSILPVKRLLENISKDKNEK